MTEGKGYNKKEKAADRKEETGREKRTEAGSKAAGRLEDVDQEAAATLEEWTRRRSAGSCTPPPRYFRAGPRASRVGPSRGAKLATN